MKINVISKENCPFCDKAKALLKSKDMPFNQFMIGVDITREEVMASFPQARAVPIITVNDEFIGGYDNLVEYLESGE
jgi:glutaredoxin